MEAKQFSDSRKTLLADFEKEYSALKSEYSQAVLGAIQEPDPAAQQAAVQRVLALNAEMSNQIRTVITALRKGSESFDPKTLDQLTNDLVEYQKQYAEIHHGKERIETLTRIHSTTKQTLANAQSAFNFYLFALIILCFLIVLLVVRSSWFAAAVVAPVISVRAAA